MSVIIFIIILGVLVFVHELGHFLAAKRSGIKVDEFAIGFPPRLFAKKIGETVYALNLIPFGGYVKIFGENPDAESIDGPESKRSFVNKNRLIQAFVLSAGVLGNIIFAWLLLSIGYMSGMPTSVEPGTTGKLSDQRVIITEIMPQSPAKEAGLLPGDTLISLKSGKDTLSEVSPENVSKFISSHGLNPLEIEIKRKDEISTIKVTPTNKIIENTAAIGINMAEVATVRYNPIQAFYQGAKQTWSLTKATFIGLSGFLYSAITFRADMEQVAGPVGIAGMVGEVQRLGFIYLLTFTSLISINLALINLVPFPALDGGRLLFVAIESITRKRINPKIQNYANGIGFLILISLMILVTVSDISKII